MSSYKFFSHVEHVAYYYRAGNYQVPLYDEHYDLNPDGGYGTKAVRPTIRRNGTEDFIELAKPDYEIKGDMLVFLIPLHPDDVVQWSYYGKGR